jgi:hypothetical protein
LQASHHSDAAWTLLSQFREKLMRYIMAWLLGVPFSVIVVWYVLGHTACS